MYEKTFCNLDLMGYTTDNTWEELKNTWTADARKVTLTLTTALTVILSMNTI
jgi:hypothetical protein